MRTWIAALLIATTAFALIAVACGDDDDAEDDALPTGTVDGNGHADDDGAEPRDVTIVTKDELAYEPAEIRVHVNEPVRLILDNSESSTLHDFNVEEIPVEDVHAEGAEHGHGEDGEGVDLHVAADAGHTGVLEFTPTEAGEYEFFCSVDGHADAGMVGRIIVEA